MRFELTTLTLARLCSTPELRPHSVATIYLLPQARARGAIANFGYFPRGRIGVWALRK